MHFVVHVRPFVCVCVCYQGAYADNLRTQLIHFANLKVMSVVEISESALISRFHESLRRSSLTYLQMDHRKRVPWFAHRLHFGNVSHHHTSLL